MGQEGGLTIISFAVPPLFWHALADMSLAGIIQYPSALTVGLRRSLLITFRCAAPGMYSIAHPPLPRTTRQLSSGFPVRVLLPDPCVAGRITQTIFPVKRETFEKHFQNNSVLCHETEKPSGSLLFPEHLLLIRRRGFRIFRLRRTLIRCADETTGEIVPTDGRRRKNMTDQKDMNAHRDADVRTTDFDKAEYTKKIDEMTSAAQQLCDGRKVLRKLVQ